MGTKIEWTEKVWNPVVGCSKVSAGCRFCYAETMAKRLKRIGVKQYQGVVTEHGWNGVVGLVPASLSEPTHWRKPRRVFVNSMSDLFHEKIPFDFVDAVFQTICTATQHTYQILTKRADRMKKYFDLMNKNAFIPNNVLIGVSCENRQTALERIPTLQSIELATRFISFEPLLESIGEIDLTGIHWAIIGGESGPKARPFNIEWAREIIRQCKAAKVPVFMKQVGTRPVAFTLQTGYVEPMKLKSRKGGDPAEWPIDLRIREYPV